MSGFTSRISGFMWWLWIRFGWVIVFMNWFMTLLWCLDRKVYLRRWNGHWDCMEVSRHTKRCYDTESTALELQYNSASSPSCLVYHGGWTQSRIRALANPPQCLYGGSRSKVSLWICRGSDEGRPKLHLIYAEAQGAQKKNTITPDHKGDDEKFGSIHYAYCHVNF